MQHPTDAHDGACKNENTGQPSSWRRPDSRRGNPLTPDEVEIRLPIPDDVVIAETDLPSGRGWWVPDHRVILVQSGQPPAERNFVLAHEAAHILLGHHAGLASEHRDIEHEADQLADVLLLGAITTPARRRAVRAAIARRAS